MQANWFIIVNPNSGGGKGKKMWHKIFAKKLEQAGVQYQIAFTEYPTHAIVLTMHAIHKGYRNIIAMGGDGTIHEVMNGILRQKEVPSTDITLSIIPVGTGNDWIKTMKIPTNANQVVDIIQNGHHFTQDVGLATYYEGTEQKERYFLNVAGTGFDAYVAQQMGNKKKAWGQLTYLIELAKGLLRYKTIPMSIKSRLHNKFQDFKENIYTVNVGIGKYFGSGMKITPNAVPNDGLFDVTMIKDISKMGIVGQLKNLYDGTFIKHPKVETFRTEDIKVQSNKDIYLQLDGELLGHGPIQFKLIPHALKVKVGEKVFEDIIG